MADGRWQMAVRGAGDGSRGGPPPPAYRHPPSNRGFTLLEILITLMILALVMAAMIAALVSTIEVQDWIERESVGPRDGLALLELMSADFRAAVLPDIPDAAFVGKSGTGSDGLDADQVAFLSAVTSRFAQDPRKLRGEDVPAEEPEGERPPEVRSDVIEVAWLLKRDPRNPGRMHLFRREDFHVDVKPATGGSYLRIHSRVRGCQFRYFTGKEADTSAELQRDWDSKERKGLPVAVSIALTLEVDPPGESGDDTEPREPTLRTFRTVVPIVAGRLIPESGTDAPGPAPPR